MPTIAANGITLDYAETGPADGAPLVLVRGLGTQRIQWPEELLQALAERGMRVIAHDNRDVGGSTRFDAAGAPDIPGALKRIAAGETVEAPYSVADMAADVVGLLDALGVERAHVAGISMGGMIVQQLGIDHGTRLRSLCSVMSSSGAPGLPGATPEAMAALMSQPERPGERDSVIEHSLAVQRVIGSPGFPTPEDRQREVAGRVFDRGHHPEGVARQMLAVLTSGGRADRLSDVAVPTLVIHGEDDPLIPIECGRDTARRVPGARFESIAGMGHDVPPSLSLRLADLLAEHARAADAP